MKEIYNGETVALGGVHLVTKQVVVDDSTGEKAKFTYDKTTGAVTVLDEVDPDSINPVTARAVANAVAGASGEIPVIGDDDNGKVLKAVVDGSSKSVEWGEAASGSDVTTASGVISFGGAVPVKVHYTGEPETVVQNAPLTVSNSTNSSVASTTARVNVLFDNTNGIKTLGSNYTATVKVKVASLLSYLPDPVTVTMVTPLMYGSGSNPQGPTMTGTIAITDGDIREQTVSFSGANPAEASFGGVIGFYVDFSTVGCTSDPSSDFAALVAAIKNGDVFECDWPKETASGNLSATIPEEKQLVPALNGNDGKFLRCRQTGATTYEPAWDTIRQVPSSVSSNAGQVLTVNSSGNPVWGMLGSVKSIQQVSELPASPNANTLYLIPEA
jgi:hypothetical protein